VNRATESYSTHAWHGAFYLFDFDDTIITVRSLIQQAWTTDLRDEHPSRRP
jgi:hypothetical protein